MGNVKFTVELSACISLEFKVLVAVFDLVKAFFWVFAPCSGNMFRLFGRTFSHYMVQKVKRMPSSVFKYRCADKSLARPGRKQARKHVTDARDFNNIETRAVIKFFFSCKIRRRRNFAPF